MTSAEDSVVLSCGPLFKCVFEYMTPLYITSDDWLQMPYSLCFFLAITVNSVTAAFLFQLMLEVQQWLAELFTSGWGLCSNRLFLLTGPTGWQRALHCSCEVRT